MKKIFTIVCALCSFFVSAQDTTNLRWVGVNEDGEFNFFKTDTSDLINYVSGYGTGQGVFMSNKDSLLYAIFDVNADGDRNLYSFNPFTGAYSLVRDLGVPYVSSADISDDGLTLYVIEGNNATLGQITSVNLTTGVETVVTTALNDPANSSYGIELNPTNNSLYVFEGSYASANRVQAIDLTTTVNTNSPMVGWSTQIHGAKWTGTGSKFIVTAGYGCDMLMTDATGNNLTSFYSTCPYNTADVEDFKMLRAENDSIIVCGTSDSTMISLIYSGTNFTWYRNGVLLPATNDTIMIATSGNYKALVEIGTTGNYMWSETIVVNVATVPVVNITQATNDTLICPSETIILTGATGGSLQWYRNGVLIPGANASTYAATLAGTYNQTKTNTSGCSDSAAVSYVIDNQLVGCPAVGIADVQGASSIRVYPNPVVTNLFIESADAIKSIVIYDIVGKEVYRAESTGKNNLSINLSDLVSGFYFVRTITDAGEKIQKIQK